MIRRPPRSTRVRSSAASDVYKRQLSLIMGLYGPWGLFCASDMYGHAIQRYTAGVYYPGSYSHLLMGTARPHCPHPLDSTLLDNSSFQEEWPHSQNYQCSTRSWSNHCGQCMGPGSTYNTQPRSPVLSIVCLPTATFSFRGFPILDRSFPKVDDDVSRF